MYVCGIGKNGLALVLARRGDVLEGREGKGRRVGWGMGV